MASCSKGKFIWSKECTSDLIELYEMHPVLYRTNSPEYKNKTKRMEALETIRSEMLRRSMYVAQQCLLIDDIRTKIHTLRSQYFKDLAKFRNSQVSGASTEEVIQPKLWCFANLEFLRHSDPVRDTVSNIEPITSEIPAVTDDIIYDGSVDDINVLSPMSRESMDDITNTPSSRGPKRSRDKDQRTEIAKLISMASARLMQPTRPSQLDDLSAFGSSMAEEMRKIKDPITLRRLKRKIFNEIMDAQESENLGAT